MQRSNGQQRLNRPQPLGETVMPGRGQPCRRVLADQPIHRHPCARLVEPVARRPNRASEVRTQALTPCVRQAVVERRAERPDRRADACRLVAVGFTGDVADPLHRTPALVRRRMGAVGKRVVGTHDRSSGRADGRGLDSRASRLPRKPQPRLRGSGSGVSSTGCLGEPDEDHPAPGPPMRLHDLPRRARHHDLPRRARHHDLPRGARRHDAWEFVYPRRRHIPARPPVRDRVGTRGRRPARSPARVISGGGSGVRAAQIAHDLPRAHLNRAAREIEPVPPPQSRHQIERSSNTRRRGVREAPLPWQLTGPYRRHRSPSGQQAVREAPLPWRSTGRYRSAAPLPIKGAIPKAPLSRPAPAKRTPRWPANDRGIDPDQAATRPTDPAAPAPLRPFVGGLSITTRHWRCASR